MKVCNKNYMYQHKFKSKKVEFLKSKLDKRI